MKRLLMRILSAPYVTKLFCWRFRKYPLVVLYHGVTAKREHVGIENYRGKHVPVEEFERQIKWLSENFKTVPLSVIEKIFVIRSLIKAIFVL